MQTQPTLAGFSSPLSGKARLERDLARLSPGQRQFFRLVIGVTRALFVPIWLGLWSVWALRWAAWRSGLDPSGSAPQRPGFDRLERPGYWLYLVGAYVAVALGLVSIIGMCFLPTITLLWAVFAVQEGASLTGVVAATLGAAALEGLMLLVYLRYLRGILGGR